MEQNFTGFPVVQSLNSKWTLNNMPTCKHPRKIYEVEHRTHTHTQSNWNLLKVCGLQIHIRISTRILLGSVLVEWLLSTETIRTFSWNEISDTFRTTLRNSCSTATSVIIKIINSRETPFSFNPECKETGWRLHFFTFNPELVWNN